MFLRITINLARTDDSARQLCLSGLYTGLISLSISIHVLNLGETELSSFFTNDSGKLTYRLADCIGDQ
jgi:hypothetical protein